MNKEELYMLRRKKKIKLRELAEHLECSISYISYYESNKRTFDGNKEAEYEEFIINYIPIEK